MGGREARVRARAAIAAADRGGAGRADAPGQTAGGVALACLSCAIGGTTVALTRLVIDQTDPLSLAFLRYGAATSILFGVMLATMPLPRFARRDALGILALGVLMYAGFPYCMARALEDTTAARAALLFSTMPLLTAVLGAVFGVERLTARKLAATALAIAGVGVSLGERVEAVAPDALRGDAIMFAGALAAALFNVFAKGHMLRYGSLPVMVATMAVGVSVLFALAIPFGRPFSGSLAFDLEGWIVVLFLAVPGGALMLFAWGRALRTITPTQAAMTVGVNPLTAMLLGAWLLAEPITLELLVGFALIATAILLASRRAASGVGG